MEQLEIIKDYENWKSLQNLRNELSHDYEENGDELSDKLDLLYEKISSLEKYLFDIIKYAEKRGWT